MTDNLLNKLFGPTIYSYTDDDAVRDGILIPFLANDRDTGHRITTNAWHNLTSYQQRHGYPNYTEPEFYRFFLNELLPLVPAAYEGWDHGDILKTDYTFNTSLHNDGILWYVPNERGGITVMQPDDY